jgi:1,4-alpha-glucan branching enzyme
MNEKLTLFLQDLNRLYRDRMEPNELDFTPDTFEWIDFQDVNQSMITFIRKSNGRLLLMAFNMTPEPRFNHRVGAPREGLYSAILNSDATEYAGGGLGNLGGAKSDPIPWNDKPYSVNLTLPPLGMLVFGLEGEIQR